MGVMRVRRENLEIRVGDVPTVQIRRRRRNANGWIGGVASPPEAEEGWPGPWASMPLWLSLQE